MTRTYRCPFRLRDMPKMVKRRVTPVTLSSGVPTPLPPVPNGCQGHSSSTLDYKSSFDERIATLTYPESTIKGDVTFLVGKDPEKVTEIKGHKLVLALSSPVFNSMFYGGISNEDPIRIPDCNAEAFKALMMFIYKKKDLEWALTLEDTMECLYVARKYEVPGLEERCTKYLGLFLSIGTIFETLDASHLYDLSDLNRECWAFIENNTIPILEHHLSNLEEEMFGKILENDGLCTDELSLFHLLLKWINLEVTRLGQEPTIENKKACGAKLLKLIRFPIMLASEVTDEVGPTGLLSPSELVEILQYQLTKQNPKPPVGFPSCPRAGLMGILEKGHEKDRAVYRNRANFTTSDITNLLNRSGPPGALSESQRPSQASGSRNNACTGRYSITSVPGRTRRRVTTARRASTPNRTSQSPN